jgi:hypothetical protein
MYGGYALLRLLTQANALTPFRLTWFRVGHAYAGVLLLMSLLYYVFVAKTSLSPAVKHAGCATLVVGILAQSGGFFLHHRDHDWRHTTHLRHRRIGVWAVYRTLKGSR